jgi:ABC-type Fe3+-citrate transport system substrate-binding protein
MSGKIPNDDRRHGKIYLENTKMAATFQLKQTEESGIYAQETAQMRTIALNYVKNHMVPMILLQ